MVEGGRSDWADEKGAYENFAPRHTASLTDKEMYHVIYESGFPNGGAKTDLYPGDFVQKGFPRKDRVHRHPPAIHSKQWE